MSYQRNDYDDDNRNDYEQPGRGHHGGGGGYGGRRYDDDDQQQHQQRFEGQGQPPRRFGRDDDEPQQGAGYDVGYGRGRQQHGGGQGRHHGDGGGFDEPHGAPPRFGGVQHGGGGEGRRPHDPYGGMQQEQEYGRHEQQQQHGRPQRRHDEADSAQDSYSGGGGYSGGGRYSGGQQGYGQQDRPHRRHDDDEQQSSYSSAGQQQSSYSSAPSHSYNSGEDRPQQSAYSSQQQQDESSPYPAAASSSSSYGRTEESAGSSPYPPAKPSPAFAGHGGPAKYSDMPVHENAPEEHKAEYSNMSGNRKALLIGVNYGGTKAELKGCHNDVENLSEFIERFGYNRTNSKTLLDDGRSTQPSRQNIMEACRWLTSNAQPNDALFFHYSGHGSQVKSQGKDESDGLAETICPVDYESAGQITDDELHEMLVKPLPKGCRLTAIFDCCHSGSSIDLPFVYSTKGQIKGPEHLSDLKDGAVSAFKAYTSKDIGGMFSSLALTAKKVIDGEQAQTEARKTRSSEADCISWSGCRDDQTSADASEQGEATGAMSHAFVKALTEAPDQTYKQLLNTIRDILKGKYDQKPQLSCSHELDCDLKAVF